MCIRDSYFKINLNDMGGGLPSNNVVGFRRMKDGTQIAAHGFTGLTWQTKEGTDNPAAVQMFAYDTAQLNDPGTGYGICEGNPDATTYPIGIGCLIKHPSNIFVDDVKKTVFDGVAGLLDLSAFPYHAVATPWSILRGQSLSLIHI